MRPLKPAYTHAVVLWSGWEGGTWLLAQTHMHAILTARSDAWDSISYSPGVVGLYTFKPALVVLFLMCCRFCNQPCRLRSPAALYKIRANMGT